MGIVLSMARRSTPMRQAQHIPRPGQICSFILIIYTYNNVSMSESRLSFSGICVIEYLALISLFYKKRGICE